MSEDTPCPKCEEDAQSVGVEGRYRNGWFRQHPWLVDVAVVLAVFTYNLPIQSGSVPEHRWPGTGVLLSVGLCAPYLLRRRNPVGVFVCIQVVAILQIAIGVELLVADVMLLLTVYNLAVRARWYISAVSAAVLVVWLLMAVVPTMARDHLSVGDVGVLVAVVAWAWTWGRLVQVRRRYIGSLRERAVQLEREKEIESGIAAAVERTRIAREIHDIVSHSLSVVIIMSDGAASTVDEDPDQAKTAMRAVRDTGRTAMADMRRMLGVLRDDEPGSRAPQPGIAQLECLIKESVSVGLPVDFVVEGQPCGVQASVDLAVFRIVQEALTNVRRHAGPEVSCVVVRLRHREDAIEVLVSDDGMGLAAADDRRVGHGIIGMRERVSAHGGTLSTGGRPGGGFEVVAVVPRGAQS